MKYSISNIAHTLGIPQPAYPQATIDVLLTDSRSLLYPESSLFFAICSSSNDGHKFIDSLYDAGVRNFVVEHIPDGCQYNDANFLVVPDTVEALQKIAIEHRHEFNIPVIGITGSKGKTTVKEWLNQLLQPDYKLVRSPRSYNSQIGVPLSVWEIDESTEMGIFEAGISMAGEMCNLSRIVEPTIGIITTIDSEHESGFSSLEDKCREKVELLSSAGAVIYNADDTVVDKVIDETPLQCVKIAVSARDTGAQLYYKVESVDTDGVARISYSYDGVRGELRVVPTEAFERRNIMLCVATMLYLGYDREVIMHRVAELMPVATRLNVIEGVNDCLLVHDSYTADLHSLLPAIEFAQRQGGIDRNVTLILSDVMHENMSPASVYRQIAEMLRLKGVERIIGVGEEISRYQGYFGVDATFYPSTESLLSTLTSSDFSHEVVLVKGAPSFRFGSIIERLEARRYETVLDVNLDAVVYNYNHFKSRLRPETGIVCMIKASGYGAGSLELAKTLQRQGASYLAVAVTDEGVELRNAGVTMPIMVLNPKVMNYKDLFTYRLEPEIYSFEIMDEIIGEAEKYGITDYPVHIKFDTGMHRLGFSEADLNELQARFLSQDAIRPASMFSHLATADCMDMDDYTLGQLKLFDRMCYKLSAGFPYHINRHILNTPGIIRFPQYQYDMVRLGIGLYGVETLPPECREGELRAVSSLHTVIISIKERNAGDTIGYSRRGKVTKPSLIATLPIGYADGLNRHLGNGALKVNVNSHLCPIIGNICMDICMIDVTDVPGVAVGDEVEIFGSNPTVTEVADILGTIPYEVLTSVSRRVKRVYYRE